MGAAVNSPQAPIGALLREWRAARRMSQLDLALEAGISARHLSCVETGKSHASRETVGRLAHALGMPLREHNLLMLAAGFAPQFSETPLYTSALERMNEAIELILRHQEPYPAFVINRHWEILLRNQAGARIVNSVMGVGLSATRTCFTMFSIPRIFGRSSSTGPISLVGTSDTSMRRLQPVLPTRTRASC